MLEKLFTSKTRKEILELLLLSKQAYNMREMERKLKIPVSAIKREINNLEWLSIVTKTDSKYKANDKCPFLLSLTDIFIKTDAFKFELEKALSKADIEFAFVFGSFANSTYTAESDIDLFIVGKSSLAGIIGVLKPVEKRIGREINPVVWSFENLKKNRETGFLKDVMKKNKLFIIGDEDGLRKIIE